MKTFVIFTSAAEHLAANLRKKAGNLELVFPEKNKEGRRSFPDGEVYIRISAINKLKNGRVIILHSGIPDPNAGLVELEMILQILKDRKIRPEIFFTYFPYCRQDKAFERGETNVAENLIRKLVNFYGVKKIYSIDPHFGKMAWVKKYPVVSISALPRLIKRIKEDFGRDILLLSPDKGGKRRTGILGLKKKRIDSFKVKHFSSKIAVKGKIIGAVDDIIGTGGTLLRFHEFVKNSGAEKIIALITHGVMDEGIKKIKKRFTKLYLANTINKKEANVDVADLISRALAKGEDDRRNKFLLPSRLRLDERSSSTVKAIKIS
jgi:ribose-phosphate pyrophosphokinase